jgi:hypothetical protein
MEGRMNSVEMLIPLGLAISAVSFVAIVIRLLRMTRLETLSGCTCDMCGGVLRFDSAAPSGAAMTRLEVFAFTIHARAQTTLSFHRTSG